MTSEVLFGNNTITYNENFWTGKKTLYINGQKMTKIDKKTYNYGDKYYTVKGSFLTGVELIDGIQKVEVVRKLTTLETILSLLPFIVILTGGAIGGLCGGAAWAFNAVYLRKTDKIALKILYAVLSTAAAFVCYLIVASILLALI